MLRLCAGLPALPADLWTAESGDTALPAVRRVQQQFAALDIDCVIDSTRHGVNAKVSNLINMLSRCRHDLLIIADSDIAVPPDYLSRVLAPLADPRVGLVTCPYAGRARAGLWSALGALFINDWFMPSVRVSALFGSQAFVSGATIALRRDVLARSGGLAGLADQLADDYKLGVQVRGLGLRIVLSDLCVDTMVDEPTLAALWGHTLRWLRTIRSVRPWGYACCFITFSLPMACSARRWPRFQPMALMLLGITVGGPARATFCAAAPGGWRQLGLIPLRDALLLALWCWSFRRREVSWRQERFGIGRDGSLHRVARTARAMPQRRYRRMKTLFLHPPSFDGFDGGAGSRYQAKREIRSFWYPTWLAQPAALVPDSKLIDAPADGLTVQDVAAARRASTSW